MINDLKLQNLLLTQQLKNLQITLDHIGAYVFTKDLEGRYTYVNQLVRELFDQPIDQIIGFDDSKFFSLELSNDIKVNDQKVMHQGLVIEEEEKNIVAKTGEVKYYVSVKKPLLDSDGHIIGMFGVSIDITERKEMEQALQAKQELLDTVLNNIDAFVYMKDKNYRYQYINAKTANLFQMQPNDIIGKREEDFMPEVEAKKFRALDQKVFISGQPQSGEEEYTTPNGQKHYYWSVKVPVKDIHGEISSYIGFSSDITELSLLRNRLQEKNQQLQEMSITDHLTKLYNRHKLDEVLTQEMDRANRYSHDCGIMIIDIDYFKSVNDTYGHQMGDTTLKEFATLLKTHSRKVDTVGRWGGEEFLIICSETNLAGVIILANKLRETISTHCFTIGSQQTASFGVTSYQQGENIHSLLQRADHALYQAKKRGRNRVEFLPQKV